MLTVLRAEEGGLLAMTVEVVDTMETLRVNLAGGFCGDTLWRRRTLLGDEEVALLSESMQLAINSSISPSHHRLPNPSSLLFLSFS